MYNLAEIEVTSLEAVWVLVFVGLGTCRIGSKWTWCLASLGMATTFCRTYAIYEPFSVSPPTLLLALIATIKLALVYCAVFWAARAVSSVFRTQGH